MSLPPPQLLESQGYEPTKSLGTVVSNAVIELALILSSDLILRPYFRQSSQQPEFARRQSRLNLLVVQMLIFLVSICLLTFFHHFPYLVMVGSSIILFRIVQLKWFLGLEPHTVSMGPIVSRPITARQVATRQVNWNPTPEPTSLSTPQQCTDNYNSLPTQEHMGSYSASPLPQELIRHRVTSRHKDLPPLTAGLSGESTSSLHVSYSQSTMASAQPYFGNFANTGSHISLVKSGADAQTSVEQVSPANLNQSNQILSPSLNFENRVSYERHEIPSITPPGLVNSGNTCFVNSTLQCLNWTPSFVDMLSVLLNDVDHQQTLPLLTQLQEVFQLCSSLPDGKTRFKAIHTHALLSCASPLAPHLVAPANSSQHQQDAAEFLLWLLNYIHNVLHTHSKGNPVEVTESDIEAMQRERRTLQLKIRELGSSNLPALLEPMAALSEVDWKLNWHCGSSDLYDLFLGQILEARECRSCKKVTMSVEYFTLLPLPIPRTPTNQLASLHMCFQKFSMQEELVQENMISCSCKSGALAPASRLALLSVVPKSLIIQLTRFSYDSVCQEAVKNDTAISFPQRIDMYPHTMRAGLQQRSEQQAANYELHAFCVHSGAQSTSFGHYMAYCRAADGRWYQYNDQHVTHIRDIGVVLESEFVLRNAYLLFYHSL